MSYPALGQVGRSPLVKEQVGIVEIARAILAEGGPQIRREDFLFQLSPRSQFCLFVGGVVCRMTGKFGSIPAHFGPNTHQHNTMSCRQAGNVSTKPRHDLIISQDCSGVLIGWLQ